MRIVGVHGVGNYQSGHGPDAAAEALAGIWRKALSSTAALPRDQAQAECELSVAYYADLLRGAASQGQEDLESLDDYELALVAAWLEECGLPDATAAGRATAPLRQALAWLAKTRGLGRPATEWFVALFFREVASYLRTPARGQVRARVAEILAARQPQVVIAHSLGSVVAYETLWEHPELRVDLLVTLGSPLALPHAVFPRLQPTPIEQRGQRPPGVSRWVNLADSGDLVALPPNGIERSFNDVDQDQPKTQPIHVFDFHKVVNYLATPQLRGLLEEYA